MPAHNHRANRNSGLEQPKPNGNYWATDASGSLSNMPLGRMETS
jgi:hypothetical protein